MARRKDKSKLTASPRQPVTHSSSPGQVLLKRILLGLVTALIVARPLVPTEDPGLRSALPDASGMVLTWLWLIAGLGWAIWHFWTKPHGQRIDFIEACLVVIVGLMLLSSWDSARYKFTAWLETWEWLSFLIVFCVVRRLASLPDTAHGLLAALLATAVMLSLYAGFQYFFEIPGLAENLALAGEQGDTSGALQAQMASQGVFRAPDDPYWEQLAERLRARNVFATYGHPNSFAGFLGLLLPAILAWTFASWKRERRSWRTIGLGVCAIVLGLALWWTHSRGALLASVAVAGGVMLFVCRRLIALHHARAVLGMAVLLVALGALAYFGTREKSEGKVAPRASLSLRFGYWRATWKMIQEHPWLGVGPGNFGRHYPMYMTEKDYEEVQDPHNFALELWACCGVFGMLTLLLALAAFFCKLRPRSLSEGPSTLPHAPGLEQFSPHLLRTRRVSEGPVSGTAVKRTPWEFYLGGMAGLILGFLLSSWHQDADEKLLAGVAAGVRSIAWFPVFALFYSLTWSGRARTLALGAGVAILLLNLCLSGGISIPGVAQPLWIIVAIAVADPIALAPPRETTGPLDFVIRLLPIPILGGLVLFYLTMFLEPVARGADLARLSLRAGNYYLLFLYKPADTRIPPNIASDIRRHPRSYLDHSVLRPLQRAAEANPDDSRYQSALANWTGVLWQLVKDDPRYSDTIRDTARKHALKCQAMDPFNREGFLAEATLEAMFGAHFHARSWQPTLAVSVPWGPFPQMLPIQPLGCFVHILEEPSRTPAWKTAHLEYEQSAVALGHAKDRSPTQLSVRFQYMGALVSAGRVKEAELEASEILRRDRAALHKSRKLSNPQREHVYRWLKARQTK
jgi:hypothetical protein